MAESADNLRELHKQMQTDQRNIQDYLKSLSDEEVKEHCQATASKAGVFMFHTRDFNFSQIVRNANFFGFGKVFYAGDRKWDRRGAVGTQNYTDIVYADSVDQVAYAYGYTVVALENNVEIRMPQDINEFEWPENTLLVVGSEGQGLDDSTLLMADYCVTIPGKGSVRSLNVSTAAGIAMSYYNRQWG